MTLLRTFAVFCCLGAVGLGQQQNACPEGYIPNPADADEDARPRLKRGTAVPAREEGGEKGAGGVECVYVGEAAATVSPAGFGGPATIPEGWDAFLVAVRDRLFDRERDLPNYICDQRTERFRASSRKNPKWRRRDRITGELLWVNRKEAYRGLKRNGKPLKTASPMATGMWTTGDYVSMLLNIFSPGARTAFRFVRNEAFNGRDARVYDFAVKQENSGWKLLFGGEQVYPAFEGTVWIDDDTLDVLRAEFRAKDVPISYPEDVMEVTIDYALVPIGDSEHLLPVRSEALGCQRWEERCTLNKTAYTNYRMFTVESTVMATDSTITFEGAAEAESADEAKPAPGKPEKK